MALGGWEGVVSWVGGFSTFLYFFFTFPLFGF
jgi:hypothetical protein